MSDVKAIERADVLPPITVPLDDPDAGIAVEHLRRKNIDWIEGVIGKRTGEQLPPNWSEMARWAFKVAAYLTGAPIKVPEFMPEVDLSVSSEPDKLGIILLEARAKFMAEFEQPETADVSE